MSFQWQLQERSKLVHPPPITVAGCNQGPKTPSGRNPAFKSRQGTHIETQKTDKVMTESPLRLNHGSSWDELHFFFFFFLFKWDPMRVSIRTLLIIYILFFNCCPFSKCGLLHYIFTELDWKANHVRQKCYWASNLTSRRHVSRRGLQEGFADVSTAYLPTAESLQILSKFRCWRNACLEPWLVATFGNY